MKDFFGPVKDDHVLQALYALATIVTIAAIYSVVMLPSKLEANCRKSYEAWSKHTGNPNGLTYDEFVHLPRLRSKSY